MASNKQIRRFNKFKELKYVLVTALISIVILMWTSPDVFMILQNSLENSFTHQNAKDITWWFMLLSNIVVLLIIYKLISPLIKKTIPYYFEEVNFNKPKDNYELINSVFDGQKAKPYFVNITLAPDSVENLMTELYNNKFLTLKGASGKGKSTLAYHILNKCTEKNHVIYELDRQKLEGYNIEDLLSELDSLNKSKIILIDDANELNELKIKLKHESLQNNGLFIWIETTEDDSDDLDHFIFDPNKLIQYYKTAYRHIFPKVTTALRAYEDNTRITISLFIWILTDSKRRLQVGLEQLDPTDKMLLLLISARYIILLEEGNISTNKLLELIKKTDDIVFDELKIDTLQKRLNNMSKRFDTRLRLLCMDKQKYRPLHLLVAYNTIRMFLEPPVNSYQTDSYNDEVKKFITYTGVILNNLIPEETNSIKLIQTLYEKDKYDYRLEFISKNISFFRKVLTNQNLLLEKGNSVIIIFLSNNKPSLINDIFRDTNLEILAKRLSEAKPDKFSSLSRVISSFNEKFDDIFIKKLDFRKLFHSIKNIKLDELSQLSDLFSGLGENKNKIISQWQDKDYNHFADIISRASLKDLGGITDFLKSIDDRGIIIINKIDTTILVKFAEMFNEDVNQFQQFYQFIKVLDEDRRNILIEQINSSKLSALIPFAENKSKIGIGIFLSFLNILGNKKDDIVKEINWLSVLEKLDKDSNWVYAVFQSLLIQSPNDANFVDLLNYIKSNKSIIIQRLQIYGNQLPLLTNFITSLYVIEQKLCNDLFFNQTFQTSIKSYLNVLYIDQNKLSWIHDIEPFFQTLKILNQTKTKLILNSNITINGNSSKVSAIISKLQNIAHRKG